MATFKVEGAGRLVLYNFNLFDGMICPFSFQFEQIIHFSYVGQSFLEWATGKNSIDFIF